MNGLIRLRGGERLHVEELLPVGFAKLMQTVDQLQLEGERLASVVDLPDGFEVVLMNDELKRSLARAYARRNAEMVAKAIEYLDFEPEQPCEYKVLGKAHGEPAAWMLVIYCCNRSFLLCAEHMVAHRSVMERDARGGKLWKCGRCASSIHSWAFVPLESA